MLISRILLEVVEHFAWKFTGGVLLFDMVGSFTSLQNRFLIEEMLRAVDDGYEAPEESLPFQEVQRAQEGRIHPAKLMLKWMTAASPDKYTLAMQTQILYKSCEELLYSETKDPVAFAWLRDYWFPALFAANSYAVRVFYDDPYFQSCKRYSDSIRLAFENPSPPARRPEAVWLQTDVCEASNSELDAYNLIRVEYIRKRRYRLYMRQPSGGVPHLTYTSERCCEYARLIDDLENACISRALLKEYYLTKDLRVLRKDVKFLLQKAMQTLRGQPLRYDHKRVSQVFPVCIMWCHLTAVVWELSEHFFGIERLYCAKEANGEWTAADDARLDGALRCFNARPSHVTCDLAAHLLLTHAHEYAVSYHALHARLRAKKQTQSKIGC